jgi:tryptophan-rich sensory protein
MDKLGAPFGTYFSAHLIAFTIVFIVAIAPSDVMKATKSKWYNCIRPSITPPNFVFPLVWSVLYILIALVLAQVFLVSREEVLKKKLLISFGINLTLNVAWSFLYFGVKDIMASFFILLAILTTQLFNMVYIKELCLKGALPLWTFHIMLPYTLWLLFACVLNGLSLLNVDKCKRYM